MTMDFRDSTTQLAALGTAVLILAAFLLLQPTGLVKWLQRKNYQYEVTTSLYMMTPTEKFVFNSILFLTLSMLSIASIIYLPAHISEMSRRILYYCGGEMGLGDYSGIWWMATSNTTGAAKAAVTALSESARQATSSVVSAPQNTHHVIDNL